MAGLVPAIHVFVRTSFKTWMPATSAGMTLQALIPPCPKPSDACRSKRRGSVASNWDGRNSALFLHLTNLDTCPTHLDNRPKHSERAPPGSFMSDQRTRDQILEAADEL